MVKKISIVKAINLENSQFIDVRSPKEFSLDHVINSINIPLFNNDERAEIGTLYKHNQDAAFNLGLDFYSKKMPKIVNKIKKLDKTKKIVVYCWRGGIRSKTITQLFELLDFDVFQLDGGYKSYRKFVRESLEEMPFNFKFIVLWGNTGVAKTKIIQKLPNKIDLEYLAQHRSSLFGGLGLQPNSQKFFETLLYNELTKLAKEKFIFIEGESRKIGNIFIPQKIYKKMKNGINIEIKASINTRKKVIINEYMKEEFIPNIKKIIPSLKEKLGKKTISDLLNLLDMKKYGTVAEIILEKYYDPLYEHTLNNINYNYRLSSDNIKECIRELESINFKLNQKFKT